MTDWAKIPQKNLNTVALWRSLEKADAHVAREGGPWVGREQAVARVPVDPKMLGEGSK